MISPIVVNVGELPLAALLTEIFALPGVTLTVPPSVKNHSAYNPESCPLAFSLKVAPKASASFGTHQEDVIFPLPSAIAVNGWWYCGSVPRESPTVCNT